MAGLAGVVIAVVTLLAATVPSGSTPNPPPAPANSASPTVAPPSSGPPAGCEQGEAAIARYKELGPSTYNAAQQALDGIERAIATSGASGTVLKDLENLATDFNGLAQWQWAMDSPNYKSYAATTTTDSQHLTKDCRRR